MKKIINAPEAYTDDMLKGIYAAHGDMVKYVNDDLRCYCTANKKEGKVAIITGARTGHTFAGWEPTLPETMPGNDLTVRARWNVNPYQITFITGGGTGHLPLFLG